MRMDARLAVGVTCAALVGACFFPDLSAFEGDASSGGDVSTESSTDVATKPDGGSSDAAQDAPTSSSPCTVPHTFCDDFDNGALGAKWDSVTSKAGPLMLADGGVSPPNALLATITSGAFGQSELDWTTKTSDTHFHLELDLRVEQPASPSGEIDMIEVTITPGGFEDYTFLVDRLGKSSVLEIDTTAPDGGETTVDVPFSEDFATWKHVALDVDLGARKVAVSVDGVQVATSSLPTLSASPVDIAVGATYESSINATWLVYFDNVTYDTIK